MRDRPAAFDPLWARVAEPLRRAIVEGVLAPGAPLSENRLAAEYSVSRTPVREALRLLMEEGLVEMLPGRKVRVVRLTERDVREIYDVRLVIEAEALRRLIADETMLAGAVAGMAQACNEAEAALARGDSAQAAEANARYHHELMAALCNRRLSALYGDTRNLIALCRYQSLQTPAWAEAVGADHRRLIERLAQRDAAGALELLDRHIRNACEIVCNRMKDAEAAADAA